MELQQGDCVIAYLTPAPPHSSLQIRDLSVFLQHLPKLEDDAEAFSADLHAIRHEFPGETNPWG